VVSTGIGLGLGFIIKLYKFLDFNTLAGFTIYFPFTRISNPNSNVKNISMYSF